MMNQLYQALENLFQKCSELPIEQMERMEGEISAAALALQVYALQHCPACQSLREEVTLCSRCGTVKDGAK